MNTILCPNLKYVSIVEKTLKDRLKSTFITHKRSTRLSFKVKTIISKIRDAHCQLYEM